MTNALEIKGLCKEYTDFKLDNVSFNLPRGSIMGFIGANGAGKTTTILSLLGIIKPSAGEINILGNSVGTQREKINEDIAVVMEDSFFYGGLRIKDIAPIMRGLYKKWNDNEYNALLKRFELSEKKAIKDLSRGMRMKLMLACALAHKPKLLILDEATSGLDPVVRSEMLDIFLEFIQNEECSILMSSHITTDLERVSDYVTFIHKGKIVFTREKDDVLNNYGLVKCSEEQLLQIDKALIAGVRRSKFDCEALVTDKNEVMRRVRGIMCEKAGLDDIMTFTAREGK